MTIWFQLVDDANGVWKHGLLNSDLSPKQSFEVYEVMAQQLASATYLRTPEAGPQVEAYEFAAHDAPTRVVVAWSNEDAPHSVEVQAGTAEVVSQTGAITFVGDGDDGLVDGLVHVALGLDAVYVRYPAGTR
jgi:hypothetical protein